MFLHTYWCSKIFYLLAVQRSAYVSFANCFVGLVRSVEVLERWAKDPVLFSMLQRQQMDLGHTLPLGTYLCKPVQRILKYHLLLKARYILLLLHIQDRISNYGSNASLLEMCGNGLQHSHSLPFPSVHSHSQSHSHEP